MADAYKFADDIDLAATEGDSLAEARLWKVLIVDDEPEVHTLTKLNLRDLEFRGGRLKFLSAYSAREARDVIGGHDDIAVILLDVVMEEEDAGLKLVDEIRQDLGDRRVRIVLRTGQPGQAPETEAILKYDINDYRSKTELTQERLATSVIGALRNYADIVDLEKMEHERRLAEEKSAARSLFLASVSHEIRTPMSGILGTLDLLSGSEIGTEEQELIDTCRDSAHFLLSIIDDILDLSKIEAGKLAIVPDTVNLEDLIHGALDPIATRAWLKDIDLLCAVAPSTPRLVKCDPTRVQQILINLVGNAIKFTHHGHVIVRVLPEYSDDTSCTVRFEVEDTGIGLSEEERQRLFMPFEQATTNTARKYGGTGLGLAICRRLVDMMDGEIDVSSRKGEGARFWFRLTLPVVEPAETSDRSLADVRVLLVADQGGTAAHARSILLDEGAEVLQATSPDEAVMLIRQEQQRGAAVHAVVVDEVVRGQHCFHTIRAIQEKAGFKDLPIAVMVRRSSRSLINRIRKYGIDRLVMKAIRRQILVRTVELMLNPDRSGAEAMSDDSRFHQTAGAAENDVFFPEARILVAEDTPASQIVIRRMLERLAAKVSVVENGEQALDAVLMNPGYYDLVLADCHMPEMDGYTFVRELRREERASGTHMPVVGLSASALPEEIALSRNAGMDDYLTKPTTMRALKEALEKWLPETCARVSTMQQPVLSLVKAQAAAKVGKTPLQEEASRAGLDLNTLLETFGTINDKAQVVIDSFLNDTPHYLDDLLKASREEDAVKTREAAHRVASSSTVVGGTELFRAAKVVEKEAQADDWQSVREDVEQVYERFDRIRRFFDALGTSS